jgi:hypothetical protein
VVVGELANTAAIEPAAQEAWTIGTSLLSDIAWNLIVDGIILLVVVWVAGQTRPAFALRRFAAPYMRERPAVIYALVTLLFLLMIVWGPTPAFRRPLSLLLIAVLLVIGVEALRRQTAREFPDATIAEGGLRESWDRTRQSVSQRMSRTPSGATEDTRIDQLERLATLRERGVLTDEEFEAQKRALLPTS